MWTFFEKNNLMHQRWRLLRIVRSDFMFVDIEPYNSKNVSYFKLSKYCDIDARLSSLCKWEHTYYDYLEY